MCVFVCTMYIIMFELILHILCNICCLIKLDNAKHISMLFSPSLTGKKSNELLQGGLSSIKHAATSVAKKLDEIKEAISANSTPVKSSGPLDRINNTSEDDLINDNSSVSRSRRVSGELDLWGRLSESRKSSYNNLVPLGEHTTTTNAYPILPDSVYPHVSEVFIHLLNIFLKKKYLFFNVLDTGKY